MHTTARCTEQPKPPLPKPTLFDRARDPRTRLITGGKGIIAPGGGQ